jgi:hypothetical protein
MEMLSFGQPLGAVMQMAFVVDDIEREVQHYVRSLGVGPFFHFPHFPAIDSRYRGQPCQADFAVALAFSGSLCVELIRQNDDAPSPFRDHVAKRGFGLHHYALSTRTLDADVERYLAAGMTVLGSAATAIGGRAVYLESASGSGAVLELIEMLPPVEQFFGMLREAAQSWDGSEPLRQLAP